MGLGRMPEMDINSSVVTNPTGLWDEALGHGSKSSLRGPCMHHYLGDREDGGRVVSVAFKNNEEVEWLMNARGNLPKDELVYKKPGEKYLHDRYLPFMGDVPKTHGVDDGTEHGPNGEDL